MPVSYQPYLPDQDLLLPHSMRKWLPEGHLAYFINDTSLFECYPNECLLLARDLTDLQRPTRRYHGQAGEAGRDDDSGPFPCPGIAG